MRRKIILTFEAEIDGDADLSEKVLGLLRAHAADIDSSDQRIHGATFGTIDYDYGRGRVSWAVAYDWANPACAFRTAPNSNDNDRTAP